MAMADPGSSGVTVVLGEPCITDQSKSTSDILGECRNTLYSDSAPELYAIMRTMVDLMCRVDVRLTSIEKNTSTLDEVNSKLDSLTKRVEKSENAVSSVQRRMTELEGDMQGSSNLFDGVKQEASQASSHVKVLKQEVEQMKVREGQMKGEIANLRSMCDELNAKATDARCRSMKYNLLFHGIEETDGAEDCEKVIKTFIAEKLKIEDEIPFKNVHRIGSLTSRSDNRPRPIIAKFVFYKHLTNVKQSAFRLKKTPYGINEQFPPEIEAVRKRLYPIAKAERIKGKKARIVKDRLYVNNSLVDPDTYVFEIQETPATAHTPQAPPRTKRPRTGSTPEHT